MIQVRLGIASSLFAALRGKHEATAQHCLRVALACSAWAEKIGLSDRQRDELELAALLHDIGKIAVPDEILWKPGSLTPQQAEMMDTHWHTGLDILRASCALPEVLDIVVHARSWFDGTRHRQEMVGEEMPLGARMLAIVDAFDAMLSDHVYRRALSLERAYHELYRNTGTQFDPQLVVLFIRLFEGDQLNMQTVARQLAAGARSRDGQLTLAAQRQAALGERLVSRPGFAVPTKVARQFVGRRRVSRQYRQDHALEPRRRAAHRYFGS